MAYATQQDLIDRFGDAELIQLTDRENRPATTINAVVVASALADASATADSYLSVKYSVPVDPAPPVLARIVAEIARYYLHGRRTEKDDPVTLDYVRALAWLRDASRGVVQLDDAGTTPSQAGAGSVQTSAPSRQFTRDSLKGY